MCPSDFKEESGSNEESPSRGHPRCRIDLKVEVHYPDTNPQYALEDITRTLKYMGAFDTMKRST